MIRKGEKMWQNMMQKDIYVLVMANDKDLLSDLKEKISQKRIRFLVTEDLLISWKAL